MSDFKVVVTVPAQDADKLRNAIGEAGGGQTGNYSFCSFSVKGTGRFTPNKEANPAIGEIGRPEQVNEERIEVNCKEENLKAIISAIRAAHSYEEPVIDVYKLENYAD